MRRINPESDLFPCFTPLIPWSIFSTLDHIPRSDEARQSGWLREYDPALHDVIFVSHTTGAGPANVQPGVYDVGAPDILEGSETTTSSTAWSISFPLLSGKYASETYSRGSARRGRARAVPPLCTE